jgi:dolichol-phosphate mannosyltransferase
MLSPTRAFSILKRWIAFCSVGAIGILVQMSVLMLLISGFKINYLLATGLAVEAAVLNNFFWHENWTWSDRTKGSHAAFWRRLFYFHLANGALSLAGNIALMKLFIDVLKCGYLQANALAIASCSVFNFLAGDLVVYRSEKILKSAGGENG